MIYPAVSPPVFIGNEIFRRSRHGERHPLAIPRVSAVMDLCRSLGWFEDARYVESRQATVDELLAFHERDYVEALLRAERGVALAPEEKRRFNIGINGNPIFGEIFSRPATACGATLTAVDLLADGPGVVYSPAGGTHHGRPDRASGFCYLNDPVIGLLRFLDQGFERLLYVDIDAHHCDGVQDAFAGDSRVLMISIHEKGRWPRTGAADDDGGGSAINLPVEPGFNDSEMAFLRDEVVLPAVDRYAPQAIFLQTGSDALAEDPLSRLELSNGAIWDFVAAVRDSTNRLLVVGGGGYNPWSVARCWSGIWATLNHLSLPTSLPDRAEAVLRDLQWHRSAGRNPPEHWFTTLRDEVRPGPVRRSTVQVARDVPLRAKFGLC
jgi:acetoin utilization protein AcuC